MWEQLYGEPGFGIWLGNFREIFMDEEANAEFSEFIADKIRSRVDDPVVAEKLIPKDHGFGVQRVPHGDPLLRGLQPRQRAPRRPPGDADRADHAHRHPHDRARLRRSTSSSTPPASTPSPAPSTASTSEGVGGQKLRDKWADGPITYLGMQVSGFPNMIMLAGPQSGSASTNFPRGIEIGVDWATGLLEHMWKQRLHAHGGHRGGRGSEWTDHVAQMYAMVLMRKAQELVHRLQLERRRPRAGQDPLLRLQRRLAPVPPPHHRGGRRGVQGHRVRLREREPATASG